MMKKWQTSCVLIVLLLPSLAIGQKNRATEVLLKAAMNNELVDGDLKAAIEQYKKIVAVPGVKRALAARALLHIGICYEKLGKFEAREAYERLLRDYADQQEQVAAARARLAALVESPTDIEASGVVVRQVWTRPALVVSPDGRYLIFKDRDDLAVHDLRIGENRRLARGTRGFTAYPAISPDGQQVAYLSWARARSCESSV
ncbi:tetratricopeptide repeat protein [Acidobacteria bacterium AH-259-G07]|nr:tetratricopeptide repeat protein [Acidobacteria bacterium AH-259-G07]